MAEVTINHAGPASAAPASAAPAAIVDAAGRRLVLRELSLLQEQDLLAAMGPDHAGNSLTLSRALLAARVAEIDGRAVPVPTSNPLYRAMLQQVGKDGLAAVVATMTPPEGEEAAAADDTVALAKNS